MIGARWIGESGNPQRRPSLDDPASGEGRKELTARAQETEHQRDTDLQKYENFEMASAAFQIGIVLASASVITGMLALVYGAAGLGAYLPALRRHEGVARHVGSVGTSGP